jgi:DNA-binding NarL/FixJ family response regulator
MSEADPLPVALVEDDRVLRESLRALVAGTPGFQCVAAAGSVEEALRTRVEPPPRVVLLDIHLPGMSGADGVVPLLERWPHAVVVMHTVYDEDDKVLTSLCNGAVGYVLKRTPPARLLEALREAHEGGAPMSPAIARKVVALFRRTAPRAAGGEALTPQETRLLAQLAQGASYADAAAELGVSLNTVRTHIRSIYEKLHVHSKSAAVARALRAGLI